MSCVIEGTRAPVNVKNVGDSAAPAPGNGHLELSATSGFLHLQRAALPKVTILSTVAMTEQCRNIKDPAISVHCGTTLKVTI